MRRRRSTHVRERGYFILDVIFGLAFIGVLLVLVGAAVSQWQRASKALAVQREAVALAEASLARLHVGELPDEGVHVATFNAEAPEGWRWVRVEATVEGRTAELVGLAPDWGAVRRSAP